MAIDTASIKAEFANIVDTQWRIRKPYLTDPADNPNNPPISQFPAVRNTLCDAYNKLIDIYVDFQGSGMLWLHDKLIAPRAGVVLRKLRDDLIALRPTLPTAFSPSDLWQST